MNLFRPPIFDALSGSQSILVAGAGGGFDVFSGLPLRYPQQIKSLDGFVETDYAIQAFQRAHSAIRPHRDLPM